MIFRLHNKLNVNLGPDEYIMLNQNKPKAVGSSIIAKLTDHLALEAVRVAGLQARVSKSNHHNLAKLNHSHDHRPFSLMISPSEKIWKLFPNSLS